MVRQGAAKPVAVWLRGHTYPSRILIFLGGTVLSSKGNVGEICELWTARATTNMIETNETTDG